MTAPTQTTTATHRAFVRNNLTVTGAHAALDRRSVRRFNAEPVPDSQIEELLELTARAPSAFNVQPWRFVVIRDQALKQQLSAAAYNQQQVVSAPVVIAIYSDMENVLETIEEVVNPAMPADKIADTVVMLQRTFGGMTPEVRASWGNAQANIALGYLLLLAKEFGLDTSPMLGFAQDQVKTLLGIPASATITALVAIGHGAEEGFVSHRHDVKRIASFR